MNRSETDGKSVNVWHGHHHDVDISTTNVVNISNTDVGHSAFLN